MQLASNPIADIWLSFENVAVQKLEEDLESGRLAPAGPTPSPGAATPLGTPTADGAAPDEPGALSTATVPHVCFNQPWRCFVTIQARHASLELIAILSTT